MNIDRAYSVETWYVQAFHVTRCNQLLPGNSYHHISTMINKRERNMQFAISKLILSNTSAIHPPIFSPFLLNVRWVWFEGVQWGAKSAHRDTSLLLLTMGQACRILTSNRRRKTNSFYKWVASNKCVMKSPDVTSTKRSGSNITVSVLSLKVKSAKINQLFAIDQLKQIIVIICKELGETK